MKSHFSNCIPKASRTTFPLGKDDTIDGGRRGHLITFSYILGGLTILGRNLHLLLTHLTYTLSSQCL